MPESIERRAAEIAGADRVRPPAGAEGRCARVIVEPPTSEVICELVRWCEADHVSLAPLGAGRTLSSIRANPAELGISLARMDLRVEHVSGDMTVTARAGITLGALNEILDHAGQWLPVDPPFPNHATLGAIVAASHAGPMRLCEGSVRDLVIGVRYVGHGGRVIHGGGRVVKNVAGYDLMKVMGGSFGTLGIITELSFKVRPRPAGYSIALAPFDSAREAFGAAGALADALPLAHLEVVSPGLSERFGHAGRFVLIAGLAGIAEEIAYLASRVVEATRRRAEMIDGPRARDLYDRLRDVDFASAQLALQIATVPAALSAALENIDGDFRAHAGVGVAQVFTNGQLTPASADALIADWRARAHAGRGHARVIAIDSTLRGTAQIFDNPAAGALSLMRRLKAVFDPAGIFNPGAMDCLT